MRARMGRLVLLAFGAPGFAVGVAILAAIGGAGAQSCADPVSGVPAALVPIFEGAAAAYNLGPDGASILAAINSVESDFGQSTLPGVRSGANSEGAAGPMQIGIGRRAGDTWDQVKVNAPGDPPGRPPDVYDEADAVYSAAHYLAENGLTANPATWQNAIWHYNHTGWYVHSVLSLAAAFAMSGQSAPDPAACQAPVTPGTAARVNPDGTALAPALAPPAVQAVIAAGDEVIDKPYRAYHYPSLAQLWPAYDCSGATSYVLYKAGRLGASPLVSGQFESYGQPGPGRWITIYANNGHVFIEVAGIVLNTAWYAPVQPTTPSSGPRWQPASTIAAQIAGDAYGGFTERHPPGL